MKKWIIIAALLALFVGGGILGEQTSFHNSAATSGGTPDYAYEAMTFITAVCIIVIGTPLAIYAAVKRHKKRKARGPFGI